MPKNTDPVFKRMLGMTEKSGKEKRLDQLHDEIKQLNPEVLPDLNKMIKAYSQAQIIIGHLDAEALYSYGALYSQRKHAYAQSIMSGSGTVSEKEAQAEIDTYEIRLAENNALAESRKWKNLFKSYDNLIIALRRDERSAAEELQKANDIYDR